MDAEDGERMPSPAERIARSAAQRLAREADLPLLTPEVERQLQAGDASQRRSGTSRSRSRWPRCSSASPASRGPSTPI
jgi:hypothetical protein